MQRRDDLTLTGTKPFCSGSTLVDRALVTAIDPTGNHHLIDLDLRRNAANIAFDGSFWQTAAFADTLTANATLTAATLTPNDILGPPGWYLSRPGFWHGALGPAACWAGGAAGLFGFGPGCAAAGLAFFTAGFDAFAGRWGRGARPLEPAARFTIARS